MAWILDMASEREYYNKRNIKIHFTLIHLSQTELSRNISYKCIIKLFVNKMVFHCLNKITYEYGNIEKSKVDLWSRTRGTEGCSVLI